MTGKQLLNDLYYSVFTRIFAPLYDELDSITQKQWDNLAEIVTERIKNEEKSS